MLAPVLGVCLFFQGLFFQGLFFQDANSFPASRTLPADGTLVSVDLENPALLWQHRAKIAQLAFFERERMIDTLRWGASENKPMKRLVDRHRDLATLVSVFDRGVTGATVFTKRPRGRPQPLFYLIGAASDAKRTRRIGPRLSRLLGLEEGAGIDVETLPVADTPISARRYRRQTKDAGFAGSWTVERSLYWANKGKQAVFHFENEWIDGNDETEAAEKKKAMVESRLGVCADLLGIGRRSKGDGPLDAPWPATSGQLLGRFLLRMKSNVLHPEHGPGERMQEEFTKGGFGEWHGIRSQLYLDGAGVPRERAEVHFGDYPASFFSCFRANARGLGDAAAVLPDFALGAARVAIDGKHLTKWLYDGVGDGMRFGRRDMAELALWVRMLAGLDAGEGSEPGLGELDELTVAVLPPAAGSLLPEFVMALRTPAREKQVDALLEAVGTHIHALARKPEKPQVRTLGKGEDAIRYVSLKKLFSGGGGGMGPQMEQQIVMGLLGGGFLSAKRLDDTLYVGFNPRTMRKLVRAVRAGKTLAKRDGFLQRFPAGSKRVLEAWFDFPALAKTLKVIDVGLPWIFVSRSAVATAERVAVAGGIEEVEEEEEEKKEKKPAKQEPKPKMRFPSRADLAAVTHEEYLWSDKADFGLLLHLEGGTLLSPTAWAGVVFAGYGFGSLTDLGR